MRVEAQQLTKRFGTITAVDRVDFSIPTGGRVALIGPNGSGKSTLVRAVVGLLRFEGRVLLDGVSTLNGRADVAQRVAYVPQSAPALGAPVRELVRALASVRDLPVSAVEKAAKELGLDLAAVGALPLRGLSGGMRQKLILAIALAARADLVVLDEPTASLDPGTRERFFALFDDYADGATVLLCSHRLEEVRQLVDHVLVLEEGRLVYAGAAADRLSAWTLALVEVRVTDARATVWLESHGFRRGRGTWWVHNVSHVDKLPLLTALTRELGNCLLDVNVRDIETLELSQGDLADVE